MAAEYRQLLGQKDELASALTKINKQLTALQPLIAERMEDAGVESYAKDGMSLTLKEELVAKITDFEALLASPMAEALVQRRVTSAKVKALIDEGVALPPGIDYEYLTRVSHRRTG